eukprot:CAMPEP_0176301326 /NCGR_PEP_ID=MMETSP0121_2-20121125/60795_1 /TAXON_ID=160619 /ORGANISM="Kryptoperidinium foliaceum, Strain CCMP 1326" /LENGTH=40 /DNA_ID= /DNA_START= /DNA_END= /DNA_ORIENTATION=
MKGNGVNTSTSSGAAFTIFISLGPSGMRFTTAFVPKSLAS